MVGDTDVVGYSVRILLDDRTAGLAGRRDANVAVYHQVIPVSDTKLLQVRVPAHLLKALDEIRGIRLRGDVITEAVEHYVERHRLLETLRSGAGSLDSAERDVWSTDRRVDNWVKARRAEHERWEHLE